MDILLQVLITGTATGGVYGLIALGFVLIYKATSILNLATGAFMTLGAFVCLTVMMGAGAPFWVAFLCTLIQFIKEVLSKNKKHIILIQSEGYPIEQLVKT